MDDMKPMKMHSFLILFVFLLSSRSVASAGGSGTETAGDLLQVIIPATACGATLYLGDRAGGGQFLRSFALTMGVTYGLKYSVRRERPGGGDHTSFPSGHTSAAFQGASFIHNRYGWKYAVPAYLGATFVGYSRVAADKHYVSDVVAGAAIGVASGLCLTSSFHDVSVIPAAIQGRYALSVSGKW